MAEAQSLRPLAFRRAVHRAIPSVGGMASAGARNWRPGDVWAFANDSDPVGLGQARRQCLSYRLCRVGARNRPVAGAKYPNGRQPLQLRPGAPPPRSCHPRRIVTRLDWPGSTAAGSTRGDGLSVVRRCPFLVLPGPSRRRRMGGAPSPGCWRCAPLPSPPSLVSADDSPRSSPSLSLLEAENDQSPIQGSPRLRVL